MWQTHFLWHTTEAVRPWNLAASFLSIRSIAADAPSLPSPLAHKQQIQPLATRQIELFWGHVRGNGQGSPA